MRELERRETAGFIVIHCPILFINFFDWLFLHSLNNTNLISVEACASKTLEDSRQEPPTVPLKYVLKIYNRLAWDFVR